MSRFVPRLSVALILIALLDPPPVVVAADTNAGAAAAEAGVEATELVADYSGDFAHVIEAGLAQPLSLAAGDFDEDGMQDLVVGYGDGAQGLVAVHFGNAAALYRRPGGADEPAFLPYARVTSATHRVDHLAVGDFDADGHLDLVTAPTGGSHLDFRRGDGRGGFESSSLIALDGAVTALASGDANRRDGLADLVVGVDGGVGPRLLVFEWPEGALRSAPEIIMIEEPARSAEIRRRDDDSYPDITVSHEVSETVVTGRDRRLSWGSPLRASVPKATTSVQPRTFSTVAKHGPVDLAIGRFGDGVVARVEMRLNRDALPDSVVLVEGSTTALVVTTKSRAVFTVDSTADDPDFSTGDGVCDTDDSIGDGPCTLRAAIQQANASAGADTIEFDIPGVGPHTIQPGSALPSVTDAVTIDGFSQPGSAPNTIPFPGALDTTLMIDLDGSLVPPGFNGFVLSGGSSTIRGLVIRGFQFSGAWTGAGVRLDSGGHIVEGCFIGTDPSGTLDRGNEMGTLIYHGSNNLVGGSLPEARNLLSGNDRSHGVELYGFSGSAIGNMIQGNLIGTDISGTSGIAGDYSGTGISLSVYSDGGNWIGGSGPGEGNVISIPTQCSDAVDIYAGPSTVVQGNLIGTNATGTAGIGSACNGVFAYYSNAQDCTVGGTQPGAGNVISGNSGYGLFIRDGGWTIQGNFIGVLADGITPLGNAKTGIYLSSESDGPVGDLIGGDVAGAGNVIANNNTQGSDGSGIRLAFPQVGWPTPPSEHSFLGNSIFNNTGLGIDICSTEYCTEGPTPNDPGDPDTGSNNLQNYPVVSGVSSGGGVVDGNLNSTPSTTFRVEFFGSSSCDASGYGEAERFLGSDSLTTDASGDAPFSSTLTTPASVGDYITATATDPDGNTSELSACHRYTPTADLGVTNDNGVTEVLPGDQVTYTVVVSNAGPDNILGADFGDGPGPWLDCTFTCVAAGGATCSPGPIPDHVEESIDLPAGGTATYTAVCDVDQAAIGTIENFAGIHMPVGGTDPNPVNDEVYDIDTVLPVDWGDAPDPAYPTLPVSDGARHQIAGGLYLGSTADADPGGQPTPGADGDDTDGTDDEDGVTFTSIVMTGFSASVDVSASASGLLNAWIDLDRNGSWLDPGEQIFIDEPVGPGINPLTFAVPASASVGDSFARFRLDSAGGLLPTGYAADGEVEDELVEIRFSTVDVAKTGQTTSYAAGDDGTFQTGEPWPDPRFTDNGDGTINDELTGLMWAQDSANPGPAPCNPGATRNWFLSLDYVDCLNSNSWLGHTDWRMPNIVELGSLAHYGIAGDHRPWWSSQGFAPMTSNRWWSSTTSPFGLGSAQTLSAYTSFASVTKLAVSGTAVWPVRGGDLGDGAIQLHQTGQARCWDESYAEVPCAGTGQDGDHRAGAEWPSPRFEVSGDCVTDRLTGLTWSRDANPFGFRSWSDALADTLGLSLCGFDDWRLPTTRELQTLYHFDKRWDIASPSLTEWWQSQGFINVSNDSKWTGTSSAAIPEDGAWLAWSVSWKDTDDSVIVWPVRGGVYGDSADLTVSIADSADPVMPGDPVTYSLDVDNLGPNTAAGVSLTTVLPDEATFVSSSGTGWSCAEVDLVVTCTMASLSVGAAPQVSVEITAPTTPGTMSATCYVDSTLDDVVGDNNGDTEATALYGDYGDAPDPTYPTLLASDGARHNSSTGPFLGAAVDGEVDGLPTANADGDDLDGTDDEDGVSFTALVSPGGTASVDINASGAGLLNAWIDFNADGDWADPDEQIFADQVLVAGANALQFVVPSEAVTGSTFGRFRVDSTGGLSYTGAAADGEVEDHIVEIVELDFGDAPDPNYPTLLASDGARHAADGSLVLGSLVDGEADGQPSAGADGDDLDGSDDEDGVVFSSGLGRGLDASLDVTSSGAGLLNAWLDFNADGDWDDAGEQIFTDQPVVAGVNTLSLTVPVGATLGTTFARFRLASGGGLSPSGYATDGEVEDYAVEIVEGPDLEVGITTSLEPAPSGRPLTYTITVTNNGPLPASSVTLTDTLPVELSFISSTPASPDCDFSAGTLTCDLGSMAALDTTQVTIETVLLHPVWGSFSNTATVTASELDPVLTNNTATVDTRIALFVDDWESGDLSAWSDSSE